MSSFLYCGKKIVGGAGERRKWLCLLVAWQGLVCAGTFAGCNQTSQELAPVSGVITLDERPLANGSVSFQPIAPPGTTIAGKGSVAFCDSEGRFELETIDGEPGAVVGEHRVRIYGPRLRSASSSDDSGGSSNEIVPPRYNFQTTLTFNVPAQGSNQANFELTTN